MIVELLHQHSYLHAVATGATIQQVLYFNCNREKYPKFISLVELTCSDGCQQLFTALMKNRHHFSVRGAHGTKG